jgi:endonuclease III
MTAAKQTQAARKQLLGKLHKAIKSHYKPAAATAGRPLLDQVLFACCLENAPHDAAEKAFARLVESYFDLNEIRVTTVAELSETLHDLPDPGRAALALRRVLQSVFESTYSFSLDHAKKHSIAHGVKTLEQLHGVPPFVVQHVAATALGAHLIPLDAGAIAGLYLAGIVSQEEYDAGKVAGLERFIAKKAGPEFSALLHQFGADVTANLHGATVRQVLQAVNPAAVKERFPKRGDAMRPPNPPPPAAGKEGRKATEAAQNAAEVHRPAGPQAAARPAGKTPLPPPGTGPKRAADGTAATGGKPGPKPFVVKPHAGKSITIKPRVEPPKEPEPAGGKPAAAAKREAPKPVAKKPAATGNRPVPPKKPAAAAPRKPAPPPKPVNGKAAPAKPTAAGKAPDRNHSAQLKKAKPR